MLYRTKTYIAGEWDGDSDAINQLYKWNEGDKWALHFKDAHEMKQCYDSSMPCTIKDSLSTRMNASKIFILVVGGNTATARKGSCVYMDCKNKIWDSFYGRYVCNVIGKTYSTESFIDYECRKAYDAYLNGKMKIVVLYNSANIHKNKCLEILRHIGTHLSMKSYNYILDRYTYDYQKIRSAIEN
jgi:hypothetical protein